MDRVAIREGSDRRAKDALPSAGELVCVAGMSWCPKLTRPRVPPKLIAELEQRPRIRSPRLVVLGVFRMLFDEPRTQHDQRHEPRRDEVAEERKLHVLERPTGLVAIDYPPSCPEKVPHDRGEGR
jgi:hypothetical protein